MRVKKVKNETEAAEIVRLFPNATMTIESDMAGKLLSVESDDNNVINHAKARGLA